MGRDSGIKTLNDQELLSLYRQNGKPEYMDEIFARFSGLAYGVCLKYLRHPDEAKDAMMQVFSSLISKLREIEISALRPWLYTVFKNHCLMQLRTGHRFSLSDEPVTASDPDVSDAIEDKLAGLETELSALPENQRICITGFYLKGLSYSQLQELTGLSYNEVKSHIQNGKRRLRIALTQRYENG